MTTPTHDALDAQSAASGAELFALGRRSGLSVYCRNPGCEWETPRGPTAWLAFLVHAETHRPEGITTTLLAVKAEIHGVIERLPDVPGLSAAPIVREADRDSDLRAAFALLCDVCDGAGALYCGGCDGSGEGRWDGTRCRSCGGSGEIACACVEEPEPPTQDDEEGR